jgi:hypothetical protein
MQVQILSESPMDKVIHYLKALVALHDWPVLINEHHYQRLRERLFELRQAMPEEQRALVDPLTKALQNGRLGKPDPIKFDDNF